MRPFLGRFEDHLENPGQRPPRAGRDGTLYLADLRAIKSGPRRALHMSAIGGKADIASASQMSAFDPKRTFWLFSRHPPLCIYVGRDFAPNDLDVTAQIIQLVREGQWKTDVADGLLMRSISACFSVKRLSVWSASNEASKALSWAYQ